MDTSVVGHAHWSEMTLPVKWVFFAAVEHADEGPVKPFNEAVRLWMVWCRPSPIDSE